MRHLPAISVAAALTISGVAAARETIGIHAGWGAFRDTGPTRCFAISRPVRVGGDGSAALLSVPDRGVRSQVSIRLSRARGSGATVTLSVGERRFDLVADARHAWAADAGADRAIVGAMRSARSMSVESVDAARRPFADVYVLKGAASAIDAAAVACLGG